MRAPIYAALAARAAIAAPFHRHSCPAIEGDFTIAVQDLYPESADWDPVNCRLYLSATYNLSLAIYDPITKSSEIANLSGFSHNSTFDDTEFHLNGVDFDPHTGHLWISAASAEAFTSTDTGDYSNANFTGANRVFEFDPTTRAFLHDIDLSPAQHEYLVRTGNYTNGFQDTAETRGGEVYAIGTFGNSIVKIDGVTEKPELWYVPERYDKTYGFGGIFSLGNKLVISDTVSGGFVTFDTSSEPAPTYVPLQGLPHDYHPLMADGLLAPKKYRGKIALWSDDFNGTSVYGSNDNWETARFLGLVFNDKPAAKGGFAVATFEIGDRIFVLNEFFQFELPIVPKPDFPIFDITDQVDAYVEAGGF